MPEREKSRVLWWVCCTGLLYGTLHKSQFTTQRLGVNLTVEGTVPLPVDAHRRRIFSAGLLVSLVKLKSNFHASNRHGRVVTRSNHSHFLIVVLLSLPPTGGQTLIAVMSSDLKGSPPYATVPLNDSRLQVLRCPFPQCPPPSLSHVDSLKMDVTYLNTFDLLFNTLYCAGKQRFG